MAHVAMIPRLAVFTDFMEEGWPSMDLCGDMLLAHVPREGPFSLDPARVCPPFRKIATRLPITGSTGVAFNTDRLLNRFLFYPRHARRSRQFELFHVADHTYAQLVHELPDGLTGVFCHDLDAFRCLLNAPVEPRPRWFRALARRTLSGLQRAGVVFHTTTAVAEQIKRADLLPPERLVHAPLGVSFEFTPGPIGPTDDLPWLSRLDGRPWLLHVGSCIPRKRIDVLLDVVSAVRESVPDLCLVKVGGDWSIEQRIQIARLGLERLIVHAGSPGREKLAQIYRRASVVLIPSEAEGFGLPVIEALACGAPVVASDLPTLREAGGPAVAYSPVGNVGEWADIVAKILADPMITAPIADRLAWASRFSWTVHAETIARAYYRLLQ